ncbi:hypothetical protein [Providencia phage PSTCR5]|uniref:Uncharacterized protein n=1 Tax=Providencia phage PSTCR5 TaxID=2783547 RepID=A0A873WQC5_9CAUD|nr:hypothetical protein KNV68_gp107 [Providencia phage PSTCR5]QPB12205.1 hypothetical protein [Providencia phage PSTCR5]
MVKKPIAVLEREVAKASEELKAAQEVQLAIRTAVLAATALPGSQYHNYTVPRGIGKSQILRDAAHTWALQVPKSLVDLDNNFEPKRTKLVIFAVRSMVEKEEILRKTRLGSRDHYIFTKVIVTCDSSENPHVLATELAGAQYEEVLLIIDEPTGLQPLVNILTIINPRIHPQNLITISLSSQYAE